MYPVSNAYPIEILKNDRVTDIYGTITLTNGTVIELTKGDFAEAPDMDKICSNSDTWTLGSVDQSQLKFTFYSELDRYVIYGAEVELFFALWLPEDEEWEEIPLGTYYVSECTRAGLHKLKVILLDDMDKLDVAYDGATVSGQPYDILNLISVKSGVPLGQTQEEIEALPNGTTVFGLPTKTSIQNYRDMLRDISVCLAGFGYIGRDGKLYIGQFSKTSCRTIIADHRGNDKISEYQFAYSAISCNKNGEIVAVGTDDDQLLDLEDNQFLQLGLYITVEGVLENILDAIKDIKYVPGSLSLLKSDPSFDPGDLITATGYTSGVATLMPVHKMTWKWGGGQKIEAYGEDPNIGKTKSKSQKSLENKLDKIAALENDVLVMQNVSEVSFSSSWELLASGEVALTDNKKLLFHAAVRVNMTAAGTVKFKYQHNGVDEDFIHECQMPTGLHTVTLFHFISGTAIQLNQFDVFISSSDSSGTVERLGFNGVLTGPGMVRSGFNGSIKLSDAFEPLVSEMEMDELTETISLPTSSPLTLSLSDAFTPVVSDIEVDSLTEEVSITREKEQFYLVTENGDGLVTEDGDRLIT
jgi:hypothetical protein